jgi:pepF/M3 family oligoendopeptidase
MPKETIPRWKLSNIYPGLDSTEIASDLDALKSAIGEIDRYQREMLSTVGAKTPSAELARMLDPAVDLFNGAQLLSTTLGIYLDSFVTTNSYDTAAAKKQSELEIVQAGLKQSWTRFKGWLRSTAGALPGALQHPGSAHAHAFILRETADQGAYLMSEPEEMLSAELGLCGANAWSKLQRIVTSQITVDFDLSGRTEKLPVSALINLRTHPDEPVRRRAYDAEIREWKKVREPLAACMNGVKGSAITLNRRRGRADCLHSPIDLSRIDRETLEALLGSMKDSLPLFRKYFKAKARRMSKEKLAWWDLFAPSGKAETFFTFSQARDFILENFGAFSANLRSFALRAFEEEWIDAEPRDGKIGGAYCAPVPKVKESRVLLNFDGTLELVSTLAHELGHGFHNECAYRAGKTELQQFTPMTLAETASIMCETIINNAVLERAGSREEELAILENALIGDSQTIVDIYSRFLFEKEVMERRERSELSADDLCDAMERAQEAAYGDALDERFRNPYMWTWKGHYYFSELDFYNFPYAFGHLFGTGLYALYLKRGREFILDYENLLACTGEATAAGLASRFGIDIRGRQFWDDSIRIISRRVEHYCGI